MATIYNRKYLTLPQQVAKNKSDIEKLAGLDTETLPNLETQERIADAIEAISLKDFGGDGSSVDLPTISQDIELNFEETDMVVSPKAVYDYIALILGDINLILDDILGV